MDVVGGILLNEVLVCVFRVCQIINVINIKGIIKQKNLFTKLQEIFLLIPNINKN